jgi:hypothetical protein
MSRHGCCARLPALPGTSRSSPAPIFPALPDSEEPAAAVGALGSCDLSVLHIGGERQWLVRQGGRDVADGAARAEVDAKRETERIALTLG